MIPAFTYVMWVTTFTLIYMIFGNQEEGEEGEEMASSAKCMLQKHAFRSRCLHVLNNATKIEIYHVSHSEYDLIPIKVIRNCCTLYMTMCHSEYDLIFYIP